MKYLIWGYYGASNLGDELMLDVLVKKIRATDLSSNILVRCFGPLNISSHVQSVPLGEDVSKIKKYYGLTLPVMVTKIASLIWNIDVLLVGGGTIFLDKTRHNFSLLFLAIAVFFAKLFRKKVYVVGVGIDRLTNPWSIRYVKYVLRNSDYLAVRDDFSYNSATDFGAVNSLVRSSDLLYSEQFIDCLPKPRENDDVVLISIEDYYGHLTTDSENGRYLTLAVEDLITSIIKRDKKVVLIAFQRGMGRRDFEYAQMIRERYLHSNPDDSDMLSVAHVDTIDKIIQLFGNSSLVIGMRYHALILSSIFEKPFIGISHENKIMEICTEFGMPLLDIKEFITNKVNVYGLYKNIPKIDVKLLKKQTKLSELNFKFLGGEGTI